MATPTAIPASTTFFQLICEPTKAARARYAAPKVIGWEQTPQQALEKKFEFKVTAKAPIRHAAGASFSRLKNIHEQSPRNHIEKGAYSFANHTGEVARRKTVETVGAGPTPGPPSQFRSAQTPRRISGDLLSSAIIAPNGP